MQATTYFVPGMSCEHCRVAITGEVSKLDGVSGVDVDLASGAVTVTSAQPLEMATVRGAVEEAGYQLS